MANTPSSDSEARAPLAALAVGAMATMAAFVALIIAGVAAAGLFPSTSTAAQAATDRGVWMSVQAWANPLALSGLGVIFGLAIPLALNNVRTAIADRRDAMVTHLPQLIQGAKS